MNVKSEKRRCGKTCTAHGQDIAERSVATIDLVKLQLACNTPTQHSKLLLHITVSTSLADLVTGVHELVQDAPFLAPHFHTAISCASQ